MNNCKRSYHKIHFTRNKFGTVSCSFSFLFEHVYRMHIKNSMRVNFIWKNIICIRLSACVRVTRCLNKGKNGP